MSVTDRLFDEFLKSLPHRIKQWLFPILLLILLEIGTYYFFAFFFFPSQEKETFRSVLTYFGWQIASLSELSLVIGITLLLWSKKLAARKGKTWRVVMTFAAVLVFLVPIGFYFFFHPTALKEERVDIFYLNYPDPVDGFDKDLLIKLLTYVGNKGIKTSFNWVDFSHWSIPFHFEQLSPMEKLDIMVQKYEERNQGIDRSKNPIGITSSPLEGDLFSITSTIPGANLSIISIADWDTQFAPPTVHEYLLHMIFLTTIQYRLNDIGVSISEHRMEDYSQAYFDKVIEKSDIKAIICNGYFKKEDQEIIRKSLGKKSLRLYEKILSLNWLQDDDLQKRIKFQPECFNQ